MIEHFHQLITNLILLLLHSSFIHLLLSYNTLFVVLVDVNDSLCYHVKLVLFLYFSTNKKKTRKQITSLLANCCLRFKSRLSLSVRKWSSSLYIIQMKLMILWIFFMTNSKQGSFKLFSSSFCSHRICI